MNAAAVLTKREAQIAELFAWGAAKKDVSRMLFISERTVDNHATNIYEKTGCSKVNELSAWWFCTKFNISFDLSPLKRVATALMALLIFFSEYNKPEHAKYRYHRRTNTHVRLHKSRKRSEEFNVLYNV